MKNKILLILLIPGITLLSTLFSSGQETRIPADKKMLLPPETLGDKYLPNAYSNKKTSPAFKYKSELINELKNYIGSI